MERHTKFLIWFGVVILIFGGLLIAFLTRTPEVGPPVVVPTEDVFGVAGERSIERIPVRETSSPNGETTERAPGEAGIYSFDDNPLHKIFANPVAGFRVEDTGNEPYITLVEAGTGYYYEITNNPYTVTRLSNSLIPRTVSARLAKDGVSFIKNFEKQSSPEIYSTLVSFKEGEDGAFHAIGEEFANYTSITVSPDGERAFYLLETFNGTQGILYDIENKTRRTVWASPFKSWTSRWDGDAIVLQTKPSALANGVAYYLDLITGRTEKIGSGYGLSVLTNRNRGQHIEFLREGGQEKLLFSFNLGDGVTLPLLTLPEKCGWLSQGIICAVPREIASFSISGNPTILPDTWYKGDLVFSDDFYLINPPANPHKIFDTEFFVDAVELQIYKDQYLFFLDKQTRSLWVVNIN